MDKDGGEAPSARKRRAGRSRRQDTTGTDEVRRRIYFTTYKQKRENKREATTTKEKLLLIKRAKKGRAVEHKLIVLAGEREMSRERSVLERDGGVSSNAPAESTVARRRLARRGMR